MVFYADYLVPQIVFLGDSITQYSANFTNGIIPRLQNEYQRQYDIINRGFAGYNSKWVNEIADPVFAGLSPAPIDYSVIFLGSNDAAKNKQQHVPIEDYALYLENLIDVSSAYTNNTILVGPAVVNEDLWEDRSNIDFYEYSQVAKAVAEEAGIPFVDLNAAFRKFFNETPEFPEIFTNDVEFNGTEVVASANASFSSSVAAATASQTSLASAVSSAIASATASPELGLLSKRDAPFQGYIANGNTTLNDTVIATNVSKYQESNKTYIGKKGNPKNKLLKQVLIDGLHFNNRGYDIFYKALKPYFNKTVPYSPLPYYKEINSTEYLDHYLEKSFIAAEFAIGDLYNGTYAFDIYNLTNLTIGNVTYGNVTFNNFTSSFPTYPGNVTDIEVDSVQDDIFGDLLDGEFDEE